MLDAGSSAVISSAGSSLVTPAIVAAIVAAAVSLTTFALAGRRARLERQRQLFADAFEAVALYKEFPFVVRRRRSDDGPAERARISGAMSELQAKLASFRARLKVEASEVGRQYDSLVTTTRNVAGPMIRDAWNKPPIADDAEMHSPGYDFTRIEEAESAYLASVADHLSQLPNPAARWIHRWRGR